MASSGRLDRLDSRENDALAVDGKTRAAVSATRPHRFHSVVLNLLLIPVVNNIERCSYNGVRAYAYTRGPSGRTNERMNERAVLLVPATACSNNGVEFSAFAQPAARISEKSRQRGNAAVSIGNEDEPRARSILSSQRRKCACRSIITIVDTGYRAILFPARTNSPIKTLSADAYIIASTMGACTISGGSGESRHENPIVCSKMSISAEFHARNSIYELVNLYRILFRNHSIFSIVPWNSRVKLYFDVLEFPPRISLFLLDFFFPQHAVSGCPCNFTDATVTCHTFFDQTTNSLITENCF